MPTPEALHDFLKRELRADIPPERFTQEESRSSREAPEVHPELRRETFLLQVRSPASSRLLPPSPAFSDLL